jgi:hypothetical protein
VEAGGSILRNGSIRTFSMVLEIGEKELFAFTTSDWGTTTVWKGKNFPAPVTCFS